MPSLDCFSYIQRGSSPLVLVDFCGFSGVLFFPFFFFLLTLFCSTVHLIRMHHHQQGNTVPLALAACCPGPHGRQGLRVGWGLASSG